MHNLIGAILSVIGMGLMWFLYRMYKHVGRRCDCGEIWKNRRVCKIRLVPGDFHYLILPDTLRQLRHAKSPQEALSIIKTFRWWIRNAETVIFSVCPCCEGTPGSKKVVTISTRPISLWHLYWVWWKDREQFYEDPELNFVLEGYLRSRWLKKHPEIPDDDSPGNPGYKITL